MRHSCLANRDDNVDGRKSHQIRRVLTSYRGLLVLLEIIVHKTKDERGLQESSALSIIHTRCRRPHTFPTAASPSSTSLTLLLGLGAFDSDMVVAIVAYVQLPRRVVETVDINTDGYRELRCVM